VQVKSWNLSCILRLPTAAGAVWCKSVPSFLAAEGAILALLGGAGEALVPRMLATDPRRHTVLLEEVGGGSPRNGSPHRLAAMAHELVALQARWAGRVDELLATGLPDWRTPSLPHLVGELLRRPEVRAQLTDAELAGLDGLAADLPRRLADLAGCGLPDTLVHGDMNPTNWRDDDARLRLIDWGDCGIGHPAIDLDGLARSSPDVLPAGYAAWRARYPRSDALRAAGLVRPVAAMRAALVYQRFLDGVEAAERHYHEAAVAACLRRALAVSAGR